MSDQNGIANDHPSNLRASERPSSPDGNPSEPLSSQVTLNLRKVPSNREITSVAQRASRSPEPLAADDRNISEDATSASELQQESNIASSDTGSPPVELVPEVDDGDADLDTPVEEVSILGERQRIVDPMTAFPYQDPQEQLSDTVNRLVQYISSRKLDSHYAVELLSWDDSANSLQRHRSSSRFWWMLSVG